MEEGTEGYDAGAAAAAVTTTMEEEEAFSKMHITRMLAQLAEDTYRTFEKG